eukprot:s1635_g18.t1
MGKTAKLVRPRLVQRTARKGERKGSEGQRQERKGQRKRRQEWLGRLACREGKRRRRSRTEGCGEVEEQAAALARALLEDIREAVQHQPGAGDTSPCDWDPGVVKRRVEESCTTNPGLAFEDRPDLEMEGAGVLTPCCPESRGSWLAKLEQTNSLVDFGILLAWGFAKGFMTEVSGGAGPAQFPALKRQTGELFRTSTLPVPPEIEWISACRAGQLWPAPQPTCCTAVRDEASAVLQEKFIRARWGTCMIRSKDFYKGKFRLKVLLMKWLQIWRLRRSATRGKKCHNHIH